MIRITVNTKKTKGKMKPLHGVANGPLSRGNANDISDYYKMLNPPYARLHDTNFPESREVDIHTIFPDFSLNPDEPVNYDFFLTDKYLKSIIDLETAIIYRLGETIATNDKRKYVAPPADYSKYAKICVNIIRHYNEGWADGFNYDIKYWEIWNEPSVINMWTGTIEEWLDLYKEIYTAIKEYDSDIMIGGPVACEPNSSIHKPFIEYIKRHDIIPDFYVFHCYTSSMEHAKWYLDSMWKKLNDHNLTYLPAFITEWNYVPDSNDGRNFWEIPRKEKSDLFIRMISEEGAAHTAMFLAMLQDSFVDQANYYCVNTDSLFSCFSKIGLPEKPFYSLLAFRELYELGNQIEIEGVEALDEAYAVAASNGTLCKMLFSNLNSSETDFLIRARTYKANTLKVRLINGNLSLEPYNEFIVIEDGFHFRIPVHTVALIEFQQ